MFFIASLLFLINYAFANAEIYSILIPYNH